MANCKHCGQKVESGSEFCHKCGKKLDNKSRWSRKRKIIVAVYIAFVMFTLVYGFIPTLVHPPQVLHPEFPPSRGVAYTMLKWYEVPVKDLCYSTFMRKWFTRVHTENVILIVAVYCVLIAVPFVIAGFKKRKAKAAIARHCENAETAAEKTITRITAIVLPCVITLGCAVGILLLSLPESKSTGQSQAAQVESESSQQQAINSNTESETTSENHMGNTSGNIVNGGWATIQGKQIYCTLFPKESMQGGTTENGAIYTMNIDGSGFQKMMDTGGLFLNVVGEKIYFSNTSDNLKLYSAKTDGTDLQKLSDFPVEYVHVIDDQIFYIPASESLTKTYGIGVMNTDGTENHPLYQEPVLMMNVTDNAVWFVDESEQIRTIVNDGISGWTLSPQEYENADEVGLMQYVDDAIYYISSNRRLYKQATEYPTEMPDMLPGDDLMNVSWFNVCDDEIYFLKAENADDEAMFGSLYAQKTGQASAVALDSGTFAFINVAGEWIYTFDVEQNEFFFMKKDGSDKRYVRTDGSVTKSAAKTEAKKPSDLSLSQDEKDAGQTILAPTWPASVQKTPGQSHQSTTGVTDPKSAAKAIMDGCVFKVVVKNRVYVPFVSPDIQVFLDESADIDAIGWQVECSVNGQKAPLTCYGNSYYGERDFSIPLEQGHNLLNFELLDSYGNKKSVTKEVIFEALTPETHLGVGWGVFEYKLDWLSYYDQISDFDYLVDEGTFKGNFDEMSNEEYYNEFRNLKITINGISYTPTVIDAKRGIRQTGSNSIFTPIVYEANYKHSELIIPVDPSRTKIYKVTYTNKYGLSVSKTVTLS